MSKNDVRKGALNYITKDNKAPQKRPRVYVSAHPKDLKKHLHSIADELLSIKPGIAVWYNGGHFRRDYSKKEREVLLGEMQIFVIPVTRALLREPDEVLEEYRFARSVGIPVLPIMLEPDTADDPSIAKKFNEIFGNIQFLDKNSQDKTAISYDVKLKRFLNATLIDSELESKIRDQFCAFVFLSYRKKDRAKAKELMKLIHSNEELRDLGIWYDEFLMAGETFDEVIQSTMKQSNIVSFAITDNVLEKGNYVKEVEYKHAVAMQEESDKPIVPVNVALSKENSEQLRSDFDKLPECVPSDADSVYKAFKSQLERLSIAKKEDDPVHTFLLGLAYLNGIFVEVDPKRGIRYIKEAEASGVNTASILPEANKILSDIYFYGMGVETDYFEAAEYQWAYARHLHSKAKDTADREELIKELYWLADICMINPKDPHDHAHSRFVSKRLAVSALSTLCTVCDEILEEDPDNIEIVKHRIACGEFLARLSHNCLRFDPQSEEDIRHNEEWITSAIGYEETAIHLLKQHPELQERSFGCEDPDEIHGLYYGSFYLSDSYRTLARVYCDAISYMTDKETYQRKLIEVHKKAIAAENPQDPRAPIRIIGDYYAIAESYYFMDQKELAEEYLKLVITVWESISEDSTQNDYTLLHGKNENPYYVNALGNLADMLYETGRKDEAYVYYKKLSKFRIVLTLLTYENDDTYKFKK